MQLKTKNNILYLVISVLSLLSVVIAVLIQNHYKLNLCAICILARYIIIFISLINLGLYLKPNKLIAIALKTSSALLVLIGLGYSLKHLYIVHKNVDSCSIDPLQVFLNDLITAKKIPWIFESTGSCLDSNFYLLGVPFTIMTLTLYLVIIAISIATILKKEKIQL